MSQLNILVIDDDPCFMPFLYQNYGTSAEFVFATTEMEMEEHLKQEFNAILMDGSLLGWRREIGEGADVVRLLRSRGLTTPIIMFSGEDKKNEAGMTAGADAVWSKDNLYKKEVNMTLIATIAAVRDIRILRGVG
jgi:CheY-like chemotaxis protein